MDMWNFEIFKVWSLNVSKLEGLIFEIFKVSLSLKFASFKIPMLKFGL